MGNEKFVEINVEKFQINKFDFNVNSFFFSPKLEKPSEYLSVLTHGYTASKSSLLTWGYRLCKLGIPVIIFDQPGHYLGSFNEVKSFAHYSEFSPKLFSYLALDYCQNQLNINPKKFLFGGHSLGALTSLRASSLSELKDQDISFIINGFGLQDKREDHIFKGDFYEDTMRFREQLVSPHLCSKEMVPWLHEQKSNLDVSNRKIFIVNGQDDIVIGPNGHQNIVNLLKNNNEVFEDNPKSLPHHMPERAAPYLGNFIKKQLLS